MRIELIRPHTHAGREYPAGAKLDVPHSVFVWLHEQGVARPADAAPKPSRKPRSTPVKTARKEG